PLSLHDALPICQDELRVGARLEGRLQRAPDGVNALVQVVDRRARVEVGPQRLHHLFAVELVVRLQRQQLDEQRGLAARPVALLYQPTVHADAERAEQVNLQG